MFTVPVGEWFRFELFDSASDLLQKSELLAQVCQALEVDLMLQRHRAGTANYRRELRALALWGQGLAPAR